MSTTEEMALEDAALEAVLAQLEDLSFEARRRVLLAALEELSE